MVPQNMPPSDVRFIHISDTHFGPDRDFDLHGANTFQRGQAIVRAINQLAASGDARVDFVVHTGDVTTDGDEAGSGEASIEIAASVLGELTPRLQIVNGNHDCRIALRRQFPEAHWGTLIDADQSIPESARSRSSYFEYGERLFVTLDARPWPIDPEFEPRGRLWNGQLERLRALLLRKSMPTTILMHYPPVPLDCQWIDDWMMVQYEQGGALHAVLKSSGVPINGVFFGHVHRGIQVHLDSILYASVASTSCHFQAWPRLPGPTINCDPVAFFNYVTIGPLGTIIKQNWTALNDQLSDQR